jgi:hypothetical protein
LVTYSNNFSNSGEDWAELTTSGPTTSIRYLDQNVATSPDGDTNAHKLICSTNNDAQRIFQTYSALTVSNTYFFSVFMKAGEFDYGVLLYTSGADQHVFDLVNGTVKVNPTGLGVIEDLGNGWYRCGILVPAASTDDTMQIGMSDDGVDYGFSGDGTSGIYIYGAQLESGSTPSSYIPTAGSTVTRAADTMTIPAANLPYSPTAMSIQMSGTMTGASSTFLNWEEDASDLITLSATSGTYTFAQEASGTLDTVSGGSFSSGINVPFNIASRHGSTFINGAVDGTALTANTTPVALPDLSATDMQIGSDFMGTIDLFRMWKVDITDAGIAEAST